MLVKIIIVFLGLMVLVGMIGKALFPGRTPRLRAKSRKPAVCPACGRYLMGSSGCDCGKKG